MSKTYGSRFHGGYQFPATDSARLERLPAIKRASFRRGEVTIVPLRGARVPMWDVCAVWREGRNGISESRIAYDMVGALAEFRALCAVVRG